MLGLDLSSVTGLDTLTFSAGFLGSYDRLRGVYDLVFALGWLGEMEARYKGFGLHGTVYSGESQQIISGDGFYRSTFYSLCEGHWFWIQKNSYNRLIENRSFYRRYRT